MPDTDVVLKEPVRSILRDKSGDIWSLEPEATVYDAIALMADKRIGALLVMEKGVLIGILSERDYARKVILQGKHSKELAVREIMTSPVITVTPDDTVDACMQIVTERRIRHLPVLEGTQVVGVISIGDLVRGVISAQSHTIRELASYITGEYPR